MKSRNSIILFLVAALIILGLLVLDFKDLPTDLRKIFPPSPGSVANAAVQEKYEISGFESFDYPECDGSPFLCLGDMDNDGDLDIVLVYNELRGNNRSVGRIIENKIQQKN
jgi:hypothetical protein